MFLTNNGRILFIFLTTRPWVSKWEVVKTAVTNKSPSQDSNHSDDLFESRYDTQMLQLSKTCSRRGSYGTKETVHGHEAILTFNLTPVYSKEYERFLRKYCGNLLYKTFELNRTRKTKSWSLLIQSWEMFWDSWTGDICLNSTTGCVV